MLYRFIYYIFAPFMILPFFKLFNRLEVRGMEHIPAQGAAVIIANHISSWDSLLMYSLVRRKAYFMAKQELFSIPIIGFLLRSIQVFPVKRDSVDRKALRFASQILDEGHVLVIFPEGHRSRDGVMQPFKQGAAYFAHRADAPVIPVLIENTQNAFPKSIGKVVKVTIGAPLDITSYHDRKADSSLLNEMTELFSTSIDRLHAGANGNPQQSA